jgi:acetylornithine deacetylase
MLWFMDAIALTRALVDIESVTGNEAAVGHFLARELQRLGYSVESTPVPNPYGDAERFYVYAHAGGAAPQVVFSTHIDTVPPFFPSSEDGENVYGRGSCDAKGIIAAQIAAAERLKKDGIAAGLLYVPGEERDSLGARTANKKPPGSRFLIDGEPTENHIAVASKGALRVQLTARGRMAHSAYPELGESAIEKLLDALARLRALKLPETAGIGPTTMNIGVIEGGRAPNVIPDFARAQLLVRLVAPAEELRRIITQAVEELAEVEFVLEIPFVRLRTVDGLPSFVAKYTTDIPELSKWGEPVLFGPGSIHVAHTDKEFISKRELLEAVEIYCKIARGLLSA